MMINVDYGIPSHTYWENRLTSSNYDDMRSRRSSTASVSRRFPTMALSQFRYHALIHSSTLYTMQVIEILIGQNGLGYWGRRASLSLVSRLGGVDGVYHTNSQEAPGRLDGLFPGFPLRWGGVTGVYDQLVA